MCCVNYYGYQDSSKQKIQSIIMIYLKQLSLFVHIQLIINMRNKESKIHSFIFSFNLQINAMANRAAGKGYENEAFYENIKFHFFGIENIHVMRNSLTKIVESKW